MKRRQKNSAELGSCSQFLKCLKSNILLLLNLINSLAGTHQDLISFNLEGSWKDTQICVLSQQAVSLFPLMT